MIVGIGVDIVDVGRVHAMLERYRERFARRVFTDAETATQTKASNPQRGLPADSR
jgi:holo-[acyl-carrier-protein] synthase